MVPTVSWAAAVLLALALPGSVVRAQSDSVPPGVTPALIEEGEAVFKGSGNCWACHGEDAKGARGVGADLTDQDWWHTDGSFEGIIDRILAGVPGDSARNRFGAMMPPRGGTDISEAQVRAVAAYVWSLSRKVESNPHLRILQD